MEHQIYNYSLCIALPLMLFFGLYFLLAKTPEKVIFSNYLRSRRIMGVAMLLLTANYSVHFFFEIRFSNSDAAILMNLSTYFLCYWLFSSALTTLLDRFYITWRKFMVHVFQWVLYSVSSAIVLLGLPNGAVRKFGLLALALWLVIYGLVLAGRLLLTYYKAVRLFEDSHSDDVGAYIRWMSIFTYWALIFGVGCGMLTFLPDNYIYIWILSSVPFYIYLYCSYLNYLLFFEQVEKVFEAELPLSEDELNNFMSEQPIAPAYYDDIAKQINIWIESDGYVRPGLTICDLSDILHTNRTYLSAYIKDTYDMSFRDWITGLRIEYAKQMLMMHSEYTIAGISEMSGFLSLSYFVKIFKEKEGYSPARWRKNQV